MVNTDKYFEDGYVVLDPIDQQLIDKIRSEFEQLLLSKTYDTNSKIYAYNKNPRIVDAYKKIPQIIQFAHHKKIISVLQGLYGHTPLPFSNIVFNCGSEQPLHSDYVHHATIPEGYFCGVWTAMEDIQEGSGELTIVPGSHKINGFRYCDHGLKKPTTLDEIKKNYEYYESWLENEINRLGLKRVKCLLKKGQSVIWDANLAHGGSKILNERLTRKSFVIHYSFSNVEKFYSPAFSFFKDKNDYCLRDHVFF